MYEHRSTPLLPLRKFVHRVVGHVALSALVLVGSLAIGVIGYHVFEGFSWIDSLLNASMILGGMGPVNELHTSAGKFFASFYALFSGVVFLVGAGIIVAPVFHRFIHKFHLEHLGGSGR